MKQAYSYTFEIPAHVDAKLASIHLATAQDYLPAGVAIFRSPDGREVFESKGPDPTAPAKGLVSFLTFESSDEAVAKDQMSSAADRIVQKMHNGI